MGTVIAESQSLFQHIQIHQHETYGLQLVLDGNLKLSESDSIYCRSLILPLHNADNLKHIAILGAGHGAIAKQLLSQQAIEPSIEKIYQVEIDIDVTRLCQEHLIPLNKGVFQHPKVSIITGDAVSMIKNTRRLNAVIVDISWIRFREEEDQEAYLKQIFKAIRKSLMPGGTLSMQCGSICTHSENNTLMIEALVEEHFDSIETRDIEIPSLQCQWRFLSAKKTIQPPI